MNPPMTAALPWTPPTDIAKITERLDRLRRLRRARNVTAADLDAYAAKLAGLSFATLDAACAILEAEEPEHGEPAFPTLGKILESCRRILDKQAPLRVKNTHWSIDDYRITKAFDRWLDDEAEQRVETLAKVGAPTAGVYEATLRMLKDRHPRQTIAWLAWKKQRADGTIVCPRWCDRCDGVGWLIAHGDDGEDHAERCPECRH